MWMHSPSRALDVITAFAVPNLNGFSQSRRFWSFGCLLGYLIGLVTQPTSDCLRL